MKTHKKSGDARLSIPRPPVLFLVLYTASADFIRLEQSPENPDNLINKAGKAWFVTIAGAVFHGICRLTADITFAVCILINMTRRRKYFGIAEAAGTSIGGFTVLCACCRYRRRRPVAFNVFDVTMQSCILKFNLIWICNLIPLCLRFRIIDIL